MINYAATSTHKDVDTSTELVGLLIDIATSVHSENIVFPVMVLEGLQFLCNLKCQLACRSQYHGLWLALTEEALVAEPRDHGQAKAKGLS